MKPEEETEEKEAKETKKEEVKEEEVDKEEIDTLWSMYTNPETLPIFIKPMRNIKFIQFYWGNNKSDVSIFSIMFNYALSIESKSVVKEFQIFDFLGFHIDFIVLLFWIN